MAWSNGSQRSRCKERMPATIPIAYALKRSSGSKHVRAIKVSSQIPSIPAFAPFFLFPTTTLFSPTYSSHRGNDLVGGVALGTGVKLPI